jgi:hypothetical protein
MVGDIQIGIQLDQKVHDLLLAALGSVDHCCSPRGVIAFQICAA